MAIFPSLEETPSNEQILYRTSDPANHYLQVSIDLILLILFKMGLTVFLVFYIRRKGGVVIPNLKTDKRESLTPRDINQSKRTTKGMQRPSLLHDNQRTAKGNR